MKYTFYMKDMETGEQKYHNGTCDYEDDNDMMWDWFEGDFSCDCNRWLAFTDWEEDFEDVSCNEDENRIVIEKIIGEDGNEIDFSFYL